MDLWMPLPSGRTRCKTQRRCTRSFASGAGRRARRRSKARRGEPPRLERLTPAEEWHAEDTLPRSGRSGERPDRGWRV